MKSKIALLVLMLVMTIPTFAQVNEGKYWTTAGSAGTVDEADADKIAYNGGIVSMKGAGNPGNTQTFALLPSFGVTNAVIRYNVTPVDGLFQPGNLIAMLVRFKDDGFRARVQVRLYEQNIETGATTQRIYLDSNAFLPSANFQVQGAGSPAPQWNSFDFGNNAYFIEVMLSRENSIFFGGDPELAVVQLYRTQVIH